MKCMRDGTSDDPVAGRSCPLRSLVDRNDPIVGPNPCLVTGTRGVFCEDHDLSWTPEVDPEGADSGGCWRTAFLKARQRPSPEGGM